MTEEKQIKLLHMVAIATVFRDELEELKDELPFTHKLKNLSNQMVKELNNKLLLIAGKDKDLHEQYGNVLLRYEEIREKFLDIE